MAGKNKIEVNKAKNREFYLTIKSGNNKKVMTSGETYKTRQGVQNALKATKRIIKNAVVIDNTKQARKKL